MLERLFWAKSVVTMAGSPDTAESEGGGVDRTILCRLHNAMPAHNASRGMVCR